MKRDGGAASLARAHPDTGETGGDPMKLLAKNQNGRGNRFRSALALAALVVALQPGPALAVESTTSEAGIGAAAALCSLLYGPVKVVYAALGLVFGGMAWGLSAGDSDVMEAVIMPAVRGDYVVTPAILRGEKPLEFIGHRPGYGRDAAVVEEEEVEERY